MASLHYIFAPMNASKSAQLLMVAHNYEESNMKPLIVKPKTDTRDGEYVESRALGIKRKVDLVVSKSDIDKIYDMASRVYAEDDFSYIYNVVLLDEVQFLTTAQIDELREIVDYLGIPVMAYGLRTDAFTHLFEGSKRLFEVADKFQEFKTVCPCCGGKAIFNMRLDEQGRPTFKGMQEQPGKNYLPVCSKQYYKLKEMYE